MIKKIQKIQKVSRIEFNSATKGKETRNKIFGWENILAWDDLWKFNPYFWQTYILKWAKSRD